jgi:hypothetical protein
MTQDNTSNSQKPYDRFAYLGKRLGEQELGSMAGRHPSTDALLENDQQMALVIAELMGRIDALTEAVQKLQGGAS